MRRQQKCYLLCLKIKATKIKLKAIPFILFILMSLSGYSQFIHYGLTGTVSTSNYSFKSGSKYSKNLKYPLNYGGSGGLFIRYSPSMEQASRTKFYRPIFQLETKIAQHFMVTEGFPAKSSAEKYTDVITRAEIPLMVGIEYKGEFYFLIGPSLNTNLAIRSIYTDKDGTERSDPNTIRFYKRFGVGLNLSASYSFKFLIFSVQYERSLSDVKVEAFRDDVRLKMNTIRLGLAISLFNKNNEKNKNSIYWN